MANEQIQPGCLAWIVNTGDTDFDGLVVEVLYYSGNTSGDGGDLLGREATVSRSWTVQFPQPIDGASMAAVNERYLRPVPGEQAEQSHETETIA
ncbi:MAG: hypothetical protein L0H83_04390 [Salinisphaera sp.]|nr:hypothetical protein [Salinisphaera sp.]